MLHLDIMNKYISNLIMVCLCSLFLTVLLMFLIGYQLLNGNICIAHFSSRPSRAVLFGDDIITI